MVTYNVNALDEQIVSFDPAVDILSISGSSAAAALATEVDGDLQISTSLATLTLLATTLSELTPVNVVFDDGSVWAVGDLTTGDTADANDNTIDFTADVTIVSARQKNNLANGQAGNDVIDLTSGNGNNRLFGGAGGDTITAGDGENTIFGGVGTTDASDGADVITVGSGSNVIFANAGDDSVSFSAATQSGKTLLFFGGLGGDTLTSNAAAGTLYLEGGPGGDTLTLTNSTGVATVLGGDGGDTIDASGSSAAMTFYGGSGATDAADGADTITTGSGTVSLFGNAGADTLILNTGSGNSASVFAGLGNDTITSGVGAGTYVIAAGPGSDDIDLTGHTGSSTIYGGNGATDGSDSADTITGSASGNTVIYGNAGADVISVLPGAGVSALVYAGLGADTITATPGASTASIQIYGHDDADVFNFDFSTSAGTITLADFGTGSDVLNATLSGGTATDITATRSASGVTLTSGGGDVIALSAYSGTLDQDNLVLSDGSRLIDNREAEADTLTGDTGSDQLIAGSNGDTLIAGAGGDDLLTGGSGDDIFQIGADNLTASDTLTGGAGANTLNLTAAGANITDGFFANITDVQTLQLDSADFTTNPITLGTLATATGITTVDASALSGSGAALSAISLGHGLSFTGGTGTDSLTGSSSADTFSGGDGDDTVTGGAGADSLTGGDGNDTFAFDAATALIAFEGVNTITDFDAGDNISATDLLRFDVDATHYNLGDNDTTVTGAIISSVVAAGGAGTEVIMLNTVGIATANITSQLNTINSLVTAGKGIIDIFYDSTKGHAVAYYDSNGAVSGGHTLLAEFTGITDLADMSNFDLTDVVFV